ncbi:hypothetical protein AVEN_187301-1 [Araneus ventricosus]|uniref:Uncharacterized protein n=1 Tax=Araneus ventricosus TaxID=182803 RepID=A0A4Y2TRH9_ARAVE|nr:hypothetical protein AVEN_187301-1 [Araneus ventricosus]
MDDDIERVLRFYSESPGETLIAKLKKLVNKVHTKIFPHCPSMMSCTKVTVMDQEVRKSSSPLSDDSRHLSSWASAILTRSQCLRVIGLDVSRLCLTDQGSYLEVRPIKVRIASKTRSHPTNIVN